ncbi:MAG TPA: DUF1906 domain-containing protein, partial [Ktedonobacteraceae bacterium]|nr:DUF1906 domain-containing protein [Ktedonobacteraceae bacterium]
MIKHYNYSGVTMGKACDIAWQKPSGSALAAAGFTVASLYVGQDNTGKNMTAAVVNDYHSHGVAVVANFEYGASQMANGEPQGVSDARLGLSQARACGMPGGRPIYYSADWAATSAQIQQGVIPYLVGARSVTGAGTVGVYGSYYVVSAVHAYWQAHYPGEKIWLWQTAAWSNGNIFSPIDLYQDATTSVVAGITIDNDQIKSTDVGQWPAPAINQPALEEDMAYIIQLPSAPPGQTESWFVVDPPFITPIPVADGTTLTNKLTTMTASLGYYKNLVADQAKFLPNPPANVNVDAATLASDLASDLVADLK